MRASGWSGPTVVAAMLVLTAASSGCKSLSERYIALEVWKYERCFGHLPPGFVPPGAQAAAAPGRVCGQAAACQPACPPAAGCNDCAGVEGGGGPAPMAAAPGGVSASKPVVISDELVVP
ncbi:MAG: hypothetical protein FJ284_02925 [Planctomycetes bacterium]|nr:hypothetical protein [Planctomycetota bacterium]